MQFKVNWFGLAGGITTILLIVISLFIPWWQITIGDNVVAANVSPLHMNFDFIGNSFTVPLLWAVNLASALYLTASSVIMLIYSIRPMKSYSKRLLGFSYRKPLYLVVFFIIGLFSLPMILQSIFGLSIPLSGSSEVVLPSSLTQGRSISVKVSSGFLWPFWLAVVSAGLCVAARLYHKRILLPGRSTAQTAEAMTVELNSPSIA